MDKSSLQRKEIEEVYGKISPFELRNKLIELADESKKKSTRALLDAGRGNPNWISATPREAFFTFGQFAVEESRRTWNQHDLAGMPKKEGIAARFMEFEKAHRDSPGIELLGKIIQYGITVKGFDPDAWVFELTDGIIGDNYPQPDRMLRHVESAVNDYLIQELYPDGAFKGKIKTYAVEGATAAMCYVFDSLLANNILARGDTIGLMVPIFTPYLEIPHLPRYNFEVVEILADELAEDGTHTWQYSKEEIDKIGDSSIKALFIVNPCNPGSVAMKPETITQLKRIVEEDNPNLMVISDDVYGTFVDDFRSLMTELPYHTIGVYSYSKYFGVTGWRLGTIVLHENNVFDKLIKEQDEDKKQRARLRYGGISANPENIAFIDRIVADSRQVALNHTAGLSTPQQVQMAFFSLSSLIDKENRYKNQTKEICRRRKKLLLQGLGMELQADPFDAAYYAQFDLLEWADQNYGIEFAKYLRMNYMPVDILIRLAEQSSIVLLGSNGFHGSEWAVRISLANLNDEAYSEIGQVFKGIMQSYEKEWNESKNHLG